MLRLHRYLCVVVLVMAAASGCGDATGGPSVPVPSSVTISAQSQTIAVGQTLQLAVVVRDQAGATIQATVTWSSSATSVATVDGTGLLRGIAPGIAVITVSAIAGGVSVTATSAITVRVAPVLTSVIITPTSPGVAVNAMTTLVASPRDQFNDPISATVVWGSSDGGKATVNGNGVVTGVSVGPVTISATATSGSVTVTSGVAVNVVAAFPLAAAVSANSNDTFTPLNVDIALGGMVTWTFVTTHNVIFASGQPGAPADIGNTNEAVVSRQFNTSGTFSYICSLHLFMVGTVVVH